MEGRYERKGREDYVREGREGGERHGRMRRRGRLNDDERMA